MIKYCGKFEYLLVCKVFSAFPDSSLFVNKKTYIWTSSSSGFFFSLSDDFDNLSQVVMKIFGKQDRNPGDEVGIWNVPRV